MMANQVIGPLGAARYIGYARDIASSGRHLSRLIDDILDLSKAEAGTLSVQYAVVDFSEVVDDSVRLVQDLAVAGRIQISVETDLAERRVVTDGTKIRQILINLLSNAIKFTPENGRVALRAALRTGNGAIEVTVTDTGIGMDDAGLSTAFLLFGRVESPLNRRHPGAGLGLPLTKRLVELLGGSLTVRSEPGRGTVVNVVVPPGPPAVGFASASPVGPIPESRM